MREVLRPYAFRLAALALGAAIAVGPYWAASHWMSWEKGQGFGLIWGIMLFVLGIPWTLLFGILDLSETLTLFGGLLLNLYLLGWVIDNITSSYRK